MHLEMVEHILRRPTMWGVYFLGREAQWGLERSFKALLAAGNDPIRFGRDAAFLWRHVESVRPMRDLDGALAMENLLAATAIPEVFKCSLTGFSEAYRRSTEYPDTGDENLEVVKVWIKPALDALITESPSRSEAMREDLRTGRRCGLDLPGNQLVQDWSAAHGKFVATSP